MTWPDKHKIDYVFYHLRMNVSYGVDFEKNFIIGKEFSDTSRTSHIFFPVSNKELSLEDVIFIDDIPVLFPCDKSDSFYHFKGKSLFFHHDLIKSAFYLLSGMQEFHSDDTDRFGRYKHTNSLQYRLGITVKPIVNYYFMILSEALMKYAELNNYYLKSQSKLFEEPRIMLTHDVDRLDRYTLNSVLYKLKQLVGLAPRYYSVKQEFSSFIEELFYYGYPGKTNNPVWDFFDLRKLEKEYGFRSVFYFLDKDRKHQDSYYDLRSKRVVKLMHKLHKDGSEIGLHGTVASAESIERMLMIKNKLNDVSPHPAKGIRQHRLIFKNPQTLVIQEKAGLEYDTTLGFAEHEGFRNSYCYPFRLYDFQHNRMSAVWEIPLNVMDTTLFAYRRLTTGQAKETTRQIMSEIEKFGGIFTFLWHNGFADDERWPGTSSFYGEILALSYLMGFKSITGMDVLKSLKKIQDA